eukprot:1157511-Pelagomonas_calceolata.AAC.2
MQLARLTCPPKQNCRQLVQALPWQSVGWEREYSDPVFALTVQQAQLAKLTCLLAQLPAACVGPFLTEHGLGEGIRGSKEAMLWSVSGKNMEGRRDSREALLWSVSGKEKS